MKTALIALFLLVLTSCVLAEENITLSRAILLAQNKFPDVGSAPKSFPQHPVEVEGEKYWVVEFDDFWVPVSYSNGRILTEETDTIKEAYRVHWTLQQISSQMETNEYPTKNKVALSGLLTEVKQHEKNLKANKGKLPAGVESEADKLLSRTQILKESMENAITRISQVNTMEEELLHSSTSSQDVEEWKNIFDSLVGYLISISANAESYDQEEIEFEEYANEFIQESNDTKEKNTVQKFVNEYVGALDTGTLAGLETSSREWKTTFLGVQLNKTREDRVETLYALYSDKQTQRNIRDIQQSAFEKLDSLKNAPVIISRLSMCYDELSNSEKKDWIKLNETYSKAKSKYEQGNDAYESLDYETAKTHYLNAEAYSEEAGSRYNDLKNSECPEEPDPEPPTLMEIINEFIGTPLSWVLFGLLLALFIIVFLNKRKRDGEYEEDYYSSSLPPY